MCIFLYKTLICSASYNTLVLFSPHFSPMSLFFLPFYRWVVPGERPQPGLCLHTAQLPTQWLHICQQHQRHPGPKHRHWQRSHFRWDVDSQHTTEWCNHQSKGEWRLWFRYHQLTQPAWGGRQQQWVQWMFQSCFMELSRCFCIISHPLICLTTASSVKPHVKTLRCVNPQLTFI